MTQEQYKIEMQAYISRRDVALAEAGVKIGDKVEWHAVSPFGYAEVFTGTVYLTKRGQPRVHIAPGENEPWHKGWKPNKTVNN